MEEIEYADCIHHTTTTKFPIGQRIKHLLGAPVVISSKIHCEHEPGFTKSDATGIHTRIRPKKEKDIMMSYPNDARVMLRNKLSSMSWWKIKKKQRAELLKMIASPDMETVKLAGTIINNR